MPNFWHLPTNPILKIQLFPLSTYVDSYAKTFLILYPPFENSTTRIAILCSFLTFSSFHDDKKGHLSAHFHRKNRSYPLNYLINEQDGITKQEGYFQITKNKKDRNPHNEQDNSFFKQTFSNLIFIPLMTKSKMSS